MHRQVLNGRTVTAKVKATVKLRLAQQWVNANTSTTDPVNQERGDQTSSDFESLSADGKRIISLRIVRTVGDEIDEVIARC